MKSLIAVCFAGSILICVVGAQDTRKVPMTKGVSVQMPVAGHAAEMRAADQPDAAVVAITSEGKLYLGANAADPASLSAVNDKTVFLKADARVPYQRVLEVLDALRGKSVVLLAAPPADTPRQGMVSPYGIRLTVSR